MTNECACSSVPASGLAPDRRAGKPKPEYVVTATVQIVLPARTSGQARSIVMEGLYAAIAQITPYYDDPMNGCIVEGVEWLDEEEG